MKTDIENNDPIFSSRILNWAKQGM